MPRPGRRAAVYIAVLAAVIVSGAAACGPGRLSAVEAAPPTAGEMSGVIRGRVIDRTSPAHPVAGQPVRLEIVERGSSSERQTRTDAGGAFAFSGLPVGGLRVFLLAADYQGATYEGAQRIVLTSETPVRDLSLIVYDAGGDRRALRGALLFGVVDIVPGALRVTTVEQLLNPTDRAVVTTSADPLAFPLPGGAVAVQPLDGWHDPHAEEGRITDARAITPGPVQVTYAYEERPPHGDAALAWMLPFGAARVEILVSDLDVRVATDGLRFGDPVTASGRRYRHWSGGSVSAGGVVSLRLEGLPAAGDRWPGAVAGALAAALAVGLFA
ncbi:MAG TPA: carboxypeptidase-like regulatory domain-containing protein, partial [bacterium]|nr:carboxypeptidase-like regulatory domain-containing protein [bacterium]